MAGLVPAIHVFATTTRKAWMPGTGPGMTGVEFCPESYGQKRSTTT